METSDIAPRRIGMVMLAVAIVLLAWINAYMAKVPPSFDGAMNLQVSLSLAEGDGYRRTYADRTPFPQEVQTNAPYVVPAAAVYKLFGVGIAQSQVVNQAYLVLFVLAAGWLLWRRTGWLGAGLGALFAIATPGIMRYGMSGYGEVVALAWALLALVSFPWEKPQHDLRDFILAGLCLALALCTKTVMAICVVAFGGVMGLSVLTARDAAFDVRLRRLVALGAAFVVPVLAFEAWRRMGTTGATVDPNVMGWSARLDAVLSQAGVAAGFQDTQGSRWVKFTTHMTLLAGFFGISGAILWTWLLGPFAIVAALLAGRRFDPRKHAALLTILLAAAVYFAWWLVITPTGKAWHRRILDGALLLDIAWAYCAALVLVEAARWRPAPARAIAWVPAVACVLFGVQFLRTDALPILRTPQDTAALKRTVELVRGLPADAQVFGSGWYSAPAVSLLAQRPVLDFNDTVVGALDPRRPVYFVFDQQGIAAQRRQDIAALYPLRPMMEEGLGYQVYRADFSQMAQLPEPTAERPLASRVDLQTNDYPYVRGFYSAEGNGTRWMRTDAVVRMQYDGSPQVKMTAFFVPMPKFARPDAVSLSVSVDGCDAGRQRMDKSGLYPLTFAIPEQCRPAKGDDVLVRIRTDNIIMSSITRDDRGVTVALRDVAFSAPE